MANIYYEDRWDLSENFLVSENVNNAFPPHFHRNLELHYVRSGMMEACIDGTSIEYHENEIVFVPSYYAHSFSTPESSDVIIIIIPEELMSDFSETFKTQTLPCKLSDREYNKLILHQLETMLANRSICSKLINKGYVYIILGMLIKHYELIGIKPRSETSLAIKLLSYIDNHLTENLSLEVLAEKFNYNKYYISKLFHSYVGSNFKTYLNSIRLQHAINLYSQGALKNIGEIAFNSGFNSIASFYRCFKNQFNQNPKTFFRSNNENNMDYNRYIYPVEETQP